MDSFNINLNLAYSITTTIFLHIIYMVQTDYYIMA